MESEKFDKFVARTCKNLKYLTNNQLVEFIVAITKCGGWWYENPKKIK